MRHLSVTTVRAAWWADRALAGVRRRLVSDGLKDVGSVATPPPLPPEAARIVESVLRRRGSTCLESALVLQAWHAARGISRDVVIGVTRPGLAFQAHAWLEGDPSVREGEFEVIRRQPPIGSEGIATPPKRPVSETHDFAFHRREALDGPMKGWIEEERRKYKRFPRFLTSLSRTVSSLLARLVVERRIETAGIHVELDHFHPDRVKYEPSGWRFLRRGLKRREVTKDAVFVDFGSGKGRVVYQAAARYRFARVIGVEISERLNEIARSNIERNRKRLKCTDVELVTCDAASYPIPDDMTFAYFYFPFAGDTFRVVIESIVASLDRKPRRVRLIYAGPKLEDVILATGRFRRVRSSRGDLVDFLPSRVSVYEST